jgi:hypothetical protein
VHVRLGGQAAAEVDELPDARLVRQVTDDPADERPVVTDDSRHVRRYLEQPLGRLPVDGEIVLAAEQVVVNPGDIRPGRVDITRNRIPRCHCTITADLMDATSGGAYAWEP